MNSQLVCPACKSKNVGRHMTPLPPEGEADRWAPVREEGYRCHDCKLLEERENIAPDYAAFRQRWNDPIETLSQEELAENIARRNRQYEADDRAWKWPEQRSMRTREHREMRRAEVVNWNDSEARNARKYKEPLAECKWGYPIDTPEFAAVLAAPDEDAPRHAYAAWLRGFDTKLAQHYARFIEHQLALAVELRRDPRTTYRDQIPDDGLFKLHGPPGDKNNDPVWWRRPGAGTSALGNRGYEWATSMLVSEELIDDMWFARGFPEHCAMRARTFLENADELFAAAPIRYLTLTYCKGEDHKDPGLYRELLASPYLDRIRYLRLPVRVLGRDNRYTMLNDLKDADIAALAASSHVNGLRGLDLEDAGALNETAFAALAESPNLPQLNAVLCNIFIYTQIMSSWGPMGSIERSFVVDKVAKYRDTIERQYGRIEWLHVAEHYGDVPEPEAIVEHSIRNGDGT
jgi:hypothetical protein